ncbi:suppressor of fused domain protein [Aquimarina addita]|uniref:Suppressor of fused domain protein n=1 Tax=Aquimarina addita TaxID=870485 RepID=A0ABP7XD20_9FLAO
MNLESYKKMYNEDDAVGWLAIDEQLKKVYGDAEPRHHASILKYMIGGEDPIDGTSIYDSHHQEFHRHLVSYGMSELYYHEEKAGGDFSKWGFEFTFRLKPFLEDTENPLWVINVLNNLARYVFNSGKWFEENHFIPANGPIRLDTNTQLVGFVFAIDPELGKIQTPHGEVTFLQLVGITEKELQRLLANPKTEEVAKLISELKEDNPLLITDLERTS